jgi:clan AA aspartic protease
MITGIVTADREAVIRLVVKGPSGQGHEIEAVVDTGFDGWLSLPPSIISVLNLPWRRRGLALLADGSERVFDIYEATVQWHRQARRIAVDSADTAPLVGMALLEGRELKMQVRAGGKLQIRPLTKRNLRNGRK